MIFSQGTHTGWSKYVYIFCVGFCNLTLKSLEITGSCVCSLSWDAHQEYLAYNYELLIMNGSSGLEEHLGWGRLCQGQQLGEARKERQGEGEEGPVGSVSRVKGTLNSLGCTLKPWRLWEI